MRDRLRIYLSGSIRKGNSDSRSDDFFWSEENEESIRSGLTGTTVELLNPAKTNIRRNDVSLNFGCDLYLVSQSDVVLVDARREKGIGVGAEMMFATQMCIPVISWAPNDMHYRRSFVPNVFGEDLKDWTHPFIFGLSDYVVESLDQAIEILTSLCVEGELKRTVDIERHIHRYAGQALKDANG